MQTGNPTDVVRGVLLSWPDDDEHFYDRLQVCDLIEGHRPDSQADSLYLRSVVPAEPTSRGPMTASSLRRRADTEAYMYHQLAPIGSFRALVSIDFPSGDWVEVLKRRA